jgi:putative tributyrin esterase
MAFAAINYYSRSLEHASTFNVIFPDEPDVPEPWSTYYLLHGLSDDHSTWMRRSTIERRVLGLPLVVVMPDGGRGWYTNAVDGDAYEDDLLKDVIRMVERHFPVKAERSGRAIGGLSMGGFGAVKIALKHPDLFASANSQSGVLGLLRNPFESKRLARECLRIFGEDPKGGAEDPFALADEVDRARVPALRFDCGDEDPFLLQNRDFHTHLDQLDIRHAYEEAAGSHDWQYWDRHLHAALDFHGRHLKIPGRPND